MPPKERSTWNDESVEYLLDLLKEAKKARGGKYPWDTILVRLNGQTGKNFDRNSIMNFYSDIRGRFRAWDELKTKWTGIGWDTETGCPVVPQDEKWQAFVKKNKCATSFLRRPLMFEEKFYEIFKGGYASSKKCLSPSEGVNIIDKEKQLVVDKDEPSVEGTGDSDENYSGDNTEDTHSQRSVNESRSPSKTSSSLERKSSDSGAGASTSSKKTVKQVDDCMDILRENLRISSSKLLSDPSTKYKAILDILEEMPEVSEYGKGFVAEVMDFLSNPPCCDVFLSFSDEENRILYLKKKIKFPDDYYSPLLDDEEFYV
ncbi:uncharacterized protein [Spinacia oleracea]|uniref:Myb/SANT-like domain-containing protein n=1 Tax=Spinacia oleracea TaxID=3562 RepID=A0A9R0I1R4_SPIOL|nr:uncharacterized protein LOC110781109 [Spinacia oleracea]